MSAQRAGTLRPALISFDETSASAQPLPVLAIEAAVRSVRSGTVVIVVQDGRVVQLEKTEKIRLT